MSDGEVVAGAATDQGEPKSKDSDGVAKLASRLAAGGAALTAIFALLGVTTGELNRLLRNEPTAALVMFALVGAGIAIGILVLAAGQHLTRGQVIAALLFGALLGLAIFVIITEAEAWPKSVWPKSVWPRSVWQSWCIAGLAALGLLIAIRKALTGQGIALSIGVLAFLTGLTGLTYLVVESKAAKDRPRIEASLTRTDAGWVVTAKVSAQGLTSDEHILIRTDGLSIRDPFEGRRAGRWRDTEGAASAINNLPVGNDFYQTIQLSRMGPDSDGKVDVTVTVPVTTGLYERVRVGALLETEEVRKSLNGVSMLEDAVYRASRDAEDARTRGAPSTEQDSLDRKEQEAAEALAEYREKNRGLLDRYPNCDELSADRSCSILVFPQASVRPTVTLLPDSEGADVASMHVEATEVNPDDVLEVLVGSETATLYHAYLSAGSTGIVDEIMPIRLGELPETICAVARILETPTFPVGPGDDGLVEPLSSPAPLGTACPISSHGWELGAAELHLPAPSGAVSGVDTTTSSPPVQENTSPPSEEETAGMTEP